MEDKTRVIFDSGIPYSFNSPVTGCARRAV
ncbi:hypothetical protein CP8484711_0641, partial [Chlamydia psittaci 84-8471/1]